MLSLDDISTGVASALSAHPVIASILAVAAASYFLHAAAMFGFGSNKFPLEGKVSERASERDAGSWLHQRGRQHSH